MCVSMWGDHVCVYCACTYMYFRVCVSVCVCTTMTGMFSCAGGLAGVNCGDAFAIFCLPCVCVCLLCVCLCVCVCV